MNQTTHDRDQAVAMAAAACNAALADDIETATRILGDVDRLFGRPGLRSAALALVDTLLNVGASDAETALAGTNAKARVVFVPGNPAEAAEVAGGTVRPTLAWIGRLVQARSAGDHEAFDAELDGLKEDDCPGHFVQLVTSTAHTIRLAVAGALPGHGAAVEIEVDIDRSPLSYQRAGTIVGRYGRAAQIPADLDRPGEFPIVDHWVLTTEAYHPVLTQYYVSCLKLVDDIPGNPPTRQFAGATHELVIATLRPDKGPHTVESAIANGLPHLEPVNVAQQVNASDDEMRELTGLTVRAILDGVVPPVFGTPEQTRSVWLRMITQTLQHVRGDRLHHEEHLERDELAARNMNNAASVMAVEALAKSLATIEALDTEYDARYGEVLRAMALADQAGYPVGIQHDPAEPDYPVVYIELPTGQVSWHMPKHSREWDGHNTEQKYERCRAFTAGVR